MKLRGYSCVLIEFSVLYSFSPSLAAVRHYVCYPSLSQCAPGAQDGTAVLSAPLCPTMAVPARTAAKHVPTGERSVCTIFSLTLSCSTVQ